METNLSHNLNNIIKKQQPKLLHTSNYRVTWLMVFYFVQCVKYHQCPVNSMSSDDGGNSTIANYFREII